MNKIDMLIGGWLSSCSTVIAELMALCGFDFITVDVEHAPNDIEQTFQLMQAIKSGNPECLAFVRVSGNSYSEIKRYMDAGADGIICPLVNSKEDAENLVKAIKYFPLGIRGVGYSRSNKYGMELVNAVKNDNDRSFVCIQIEHVEAIQNLDEILSVEGIDAAIIGPYDLSASMGLMGKMNHPKMEEAISKTLTKCQEYSIMPGIHVVDQDPEKVQSRIKQGYRFIAYSVDLKMISDSSLYGIQKIKNH